jgi:hypothetical protein
MLKIFKNYKIRKLEKKLEKLTENRRRYTKDMYEDIDEKVIKLDKELYLQASKDIDWVLRKLEEIKMS